MNIKLKALFITFAFLPIMSFANPGYDEAAIDNAVADSSRITKETIRDARRKPAEILRLLGVKPGMKVADLASGFGYYTAILSRAVGDNGTVIAHNPPFLIKKFEKTFKDGGPWDQRFSSEVWKKNVTKFIAPLADFKPSEPVDAAMMVLFYHDTVWQKVDRAKMNKDIFNAIKPGGTFMIIDHAAEKGSGGKDTQSLHRIDKEMVIKEVTDAGFKLVDDSDLLANEKDTHDYNVFRDYKTDRDHTDRFVLKFKRPL